jgi:hypothetical protein
MGRTIDYVDTMYIERGRRRKDPAKAMLFRLIAAVLATYESVQLVRVVAELKMLELRLC